jgi:hypothetical protein
MLLNGTGRKPMSGLQRIGVLISVLWLLAVPSYLIISSNKFADAYYKGCLDLAYRTKLNSAAELNAATQDCSTTRSELAVTPTRMLKLLLLEEDHAYGLIAWAALLAPIALMWIIGGIAFGTAGWLARGFKARKA